MSFTENGSHNNAGVDGARTNGHDNPGNGQVDVVGAVALYQRGHIAPNGLELGGGNMQEAEVEDNRQGIQESNSIFSPYAANIIRQLANERAARETREIQPSVEETQRGSASNAVFERRVWDRRKSAASSRIGRVPQK